MRPMISNTPYYKLTIPELSGGVNLRDGISLINDNQLTDCKNVWYKDGMLRTRPGIGDAVYEHNAYGEDVSFNVDIRTHDIYREVEGEVCRLVTAHKKNEGTIFFYLVGKTLFEKLETLDSATFGEGEITDFFVVQQEQSNDSALYCFTNAGIYKLEKDGIAWLCEDDQDTDGEKKIKMHIPLVVTNCTAVNGTDDNIGTQIESYNMLSDYYKMQFSTVDALRESNEMKYALSYKPTEKETGLKVTAEITTSGGTYTYTVTLGENGTSNVSASADNKRMQVKDGYILFYSGTSGTTLATVTESEHLLNNMTVTAPCANDRSRVLQMTRPIWFGGGTKGLGGGTRLFLCGSSAEKNLVIWSDLNNIFYFPENNYFYVGDTSQEVTGFGRQSDMLIIFKERETYYTQYAENTEIDAKDLINQSVVDMVSSSVYFPLVQINPSIGCDCPDTVQLCRNRLVWVNSDGRIYTLVSANQYSERSIFQIGEMVHNRLKDRTEELKSAVSCDWDGYYLLGMGGEVYVMDYNSYGYQYVSSYSKNEDANLKIPWYIFEFPLAGTDGMIFTVHSALKVLSKRLSYSGLYRATVGEEYSSDMSYDSDTSEELSVADKPINCVAQTKLFDFGVPTVKKNIPKIEAVFGTNGAAPIRATVITESSSDESEIVIDEPEQEEFSARYFHNRLIRPANKRACRMGLRFECDGQMSIDAISLQYKSLGGVK